MKYIILKDGSKIKVDNEDYKFLSTKKWHKNPKGYPRRNKSKKCDAVYMHRFIMKAGQGQEVDHKNRNKLDNRKKNLRFVNHQENMMNRSLHKNNTSGYMGVNKQEGRWIARINVNRKQYNLGSFDSKKLAIQARKQAEENYKLTKKIYE
jgi:hypothetical protein